MSLEKMYLKFNLIVSHPIRLHGEGGVYDLYCIQSPGGDQDALASLFKTCAVHFEKAHSVFILILFWWH